MNRRTFAWIVTLGWLGAVGLADAQEPVGTYDTFNTSLLVDPRKWVGFEDNTGNRQELVRDIVGVVGAGALRLEIRASSILPFSTGFEISSNGLRFIHTTPEIIRVIGATFVVQRAQAVGCAANPTPTAARARLSGFFFNTGPRTPGSAVNDVFARIEIRRLSTSQDPVNVLRVRALVEKCTNSNCGSSIVLFQNANLGTVLLNTPATLRMDWQPGLNRFLFRLNANPFVVANYAVLDGLPPGNPFARKRVDLSHVVAHCTAVSPRPTAWALALVDNVFVNTAAVLATPTHDPLEGELPEPPAVGEGDSGE